MHCLSRFCVMNKEKKQEVYNMEEKKELTRGEELRKALTYQKKNGYDRLQEGELEEDEGAYGVDEDDEASA